MLERDSVDGEEADGGVVLRAHVGDGGPVRSRQLGDSGSEELNEPPSDASLPQVLRKQCKRNVNTVFRKGLDDSKYEELLQK